MKIECDNLTVALGGTDIVKSVSMRVKKQQFIGIIGPNGSGKSTLLKTIYRILTPKSGKAQIDGDDLLKMKYRDSAKKMAVVTQHNFYNFDFTVHEVVMMGRTPHKKQMERDNANDYKIVEDALKRVEMWDFKERIFSTLSGGEQQRIMLARALAQKTECLILDEPTNHLDIKHQLKIMELAKGMTLTVVAALHDLNIAAAYCDYLYILKDGELVAEGKPKDVLTEEIIQRVYEVNARIIREESADRIYIAF